MVSEQNSQKFIDFFRFTNQIKSSQIYELCSQHGNTARNGTAMGVSLLALAHLVMKHTIQVKARQNIILSVPCCHMAAMAVTGLISVILEDHTTDNNIILKSAT